MRGELLNTFVVSVQKRSVIDLMSNRIQVRPLFASKNDPFDGAKTGVAEPHVAEQSRSWRAASGEQEVMRGS
jgi:hypothetical protein